ncbi:hypothetical protein B484DRAFT_425471, partial [Ochromonadaceae sp. CCMP2298]
MGGQGGQGQASVGESTRRERVGGESVAKSRLRERAERESLLEKKLKVMCKSVALARQEMVEIESRDASTFSHTPNTPHTRTSSPSHTSHPSVASKVWPSALKRWWLNTGRTLPKNSNSIQVPQSSAHHIAKAALTAQKEKTNEDDIEELVDAEVDQGRFGHISWYYTPVRVCERCHSVYTELDRQRKLRHKHLWSKQKQLIDQADEDNGRWRDLEKGGAEAAGDASQGGGS